jgi:hypothetical protein
MLCCNEVRLLRKPNPFPLLVFFGLSGSRDIWAQRDFPSSGGFCKNLILDVGVASFTLSRFAQLAGLLRFGAS